MKTRITIKKYVLDEETKKHVEWLANPSTYVDSNRRLLHIGRMVAQEYKKLEAHHEEETKFLIKRIEELEKQWDELLANSKALNE